LAVASAEDPPTEELAEVLAKRQKQPRFAKPLLPNEVNQPPTAFHFDILKQLAQIPARITLLELLKLSKTTREALRKALADAEAFAVYVPPAPTEEVLLAAPRLNCITFSDEDLQVRGMHDRPLYFTGYIGSTIITRIQVDQGSALSIMPRRILSFLGIPQYRLSATNTVIAGFNAHSSTPVGKIRLRCQIGDLKTEVTCYVINDDPSYNMLLGRPWLHRNGLIPSSLHQVMKYLDGEGQQRTLVADSNPFKGMENYYTDALHYQEALNVEDEVDSGEEADVEPEPMKCALGGRTTIMQRSTICEEGIWYVNG